MERGCSQASLIPRLPDFADFLHGADDRELDILGCASCCQLLLEGGIVLASHASFGEELLGFGLQRGLVGGLLAQAQHAGRQIDESRLGQRPFFRRGRLGGDRLGRSGFGGEWQLAAREQASSGQGNEDFLHRVEF